MHAEDSVHAFHLQHDRPAKVPKASIDPEKRPKKVADEPTRTDKFSMTGVSHLLKMSST